MPRKSRKNKKYSIELKVQAVKDWNEGKGSQLAICKKYGILSHTQLQQWILWYNGHREFKERSSAKGEIYMTKGRKTTQEERAEIVAFCIEHNKDYGLTVETYNVSYQQIYVKSTPEITAENILNRDFKATVPFEKWLTDVTEFKYYVGPEVKKLYLSAILDLYDRRIIAYKDRKSVV